MVQRVFVDANVLFSKTLMDWLYFLRRENPEMLHLQSTEDVFAEVVANMRARWPSAPGRRTVTRARLMREIMDEVLEDFPSTLCFTGVDPHDYHVHAGATAGRADLILSCNDPADITTTPEAESYDVVHPDDLFVLAAQTNPSCLQPIVLEQLAYWSTHVEHLPLDDMLRRAGCPRFASVVHEHLARLTRMT